MFVIAVLLRCAHLYSAWPDPRCIAVAVLQIICAQFYTMFYAYYELICGITVVVGVIDTIFYKYTCSATDTDLTCTVSGVILTVILALSMIPLLVAVHLVPLADKMITLVRQPSFIEAREYASAREHAIDRVRLDVMPANCLRSE